jgi:hypothetical protein
VDDMEIDFLNSLDFDVGVLAIDAFTIGNKISASVPSYLSISYSMNDANCVEV